MAGKSRRRGAITRETKETRIKAAWDLDGQGRAEVNTGLPFLDHMLTLLAAHSMTDLTLSAQGDLEVDAHHLSEDLGIVLGQALGQALGKKAGIVRYGASLLPMDESLVQVALDISGRPYLHYKLSLRQKKIGAFDTECAEEFFRAFGNHAGVTLHVVQMTGGNTHHLLEAAFKGLGRALREAVARDPKRSGVPSTKGLL
jgi:imidazoleglycerol-phosphate dehydratase